MRPLRLHREQDGCAAGIDRAEAARLLRAVRSVLSDAGADTRADAIDALDAALAALPDHKHLLAGKIDKLLDAGDTVTAETLLARALLSRPTDPTLTRLRARCLLMQGAPRQAEKEIRLVLRHRPSHTASLLLASRIASARSDHAGAVRALEDAHAARPRRDDLVEHLAHALLDAGRIDRAAGAMERIRYPSAVLRARVLADRGWPRDAVEVLEANRHISVDHDGSITIALIDLLERIGPPTRLRGVLAEVGCDRPAALARAGAAWLRLGAYRTAAVRVAALRGPGSAQREALAVMLVAGAMLGRARLTERARRRLASLPGGAGHLRLADLWRRALTGRRVHPTVVPGRRPERQGVLEPLVRSALGVIERVMAPVMAPPDELPADPVNIAQLEHHRDACLAVLNARRRRRPAVAAAATAAATVPPPGQAGEEAGKKPGEKPGGGRIHDPLPFPGSSRRAA